MSHAVEEARSRIIQASLHLAATEWNNGRLTADASQQLDLAQELLSEALSAYVELLGNKAWPFTPLTEDTDG